MAVSATTTNPLARYSQAQLNAAAAELIKTNPTYARYNTAGLLAEAQSRSSTANALAGQVQKTITAAQPAAPVISLPNPATATTWTTTAGGQTYYLSVPSDSQPSVWMAKGSTNNMQPVDQQGKPLANVRGALFKDWQTQTGSQTPAEARTAAAPKPAPAPAPAPAAKPSPAPAPAPVRPPAGLNLPDAATAMRQILARDPAAPPTMRTDSATGTQYYLVPPTGNQPAQWVSVPKGGFMASNGQTITQINTAQTSYITANAQPLPKPTPAPTPAPTPTPTPTPVRPQLTIAQQATIQQPILSQLNTAKTQAEFDALVKQAADAGAPLNDGQLTSFRTAFNQRLAREQAAAAEAAKTAATGPIAPVAPGATGPAQPTGPTAAQQAYYTAVAEAIKGFTPPSTRTVEFSGKNTGSITWVPPDPTTGTKGGYYIESGGGIRQVDPTTGTPTGEVIPYSQFNTLSQTASTNASKIAAQEQQRQTELGSQFDSQLMAAKTQAEFDKILADARAANITLNPGRVSAAQQGLTSQLAAAEQQRIQTLQAGFADQMREAVRQNDSAALDRIVEQAQAAGAPVASTQVDAFRSTISNNQRIIEDQRRQQLAAQFGEQLRGVQSTGDIDRLIQEAQAQGITLTQAQIDQAKGTVKNLDAMYGEIAETIKGGFTGNKFTRSGIELTRIPDDPVTGRKGGYYMVSGGGMRAIGEDGRPIGETQTFDQFNQAAAEATRNAEQFKRDQAEAQRLAQIKDEVQRFEAGLPQPGSEKFNYLLANRFVLTGPDGRSYELVAKNEKSGEPAHWIVSVSPDARYSDPNTNYRRLDNPDAVIQKGAVDQMFQVNAQIQNARAQEERARLIAEQRRKQDINVGEMTRFIAGTLAVFGGAMLIANYGPALYEKMVETIATMAEGGSSAGEIADVLTNIYDVPVDLAGNLGEVATGAVEEAITTIPGVQPPPGYSLPPGLTESEIIPGFGGTPPPPAPIPPPIPGPENVLEFGFPEVPAPAPPAPTPPTGPGNVFEYGFPEAPPAPTPPTPTPPTPTPPAGPENVLEYGYPEAPVAPGPTPGELPQPIEYPNVEPPTQQPVEVARAPGTMTDVPVAEEPLRIEITGLPEQTPIPEGLDYPDLGPPDYVYEPTIEPSPFGEPGPTPVAPGIPTAPPGPETVFEYGFPEAPIVPPVSPPTIPPVPGPETTFEFGFPETPVGPPAPPSGPGGPSVPGPDTTFEFGFPETPAGPITPGPGVPSVPGPDTVFEYGFPEVPPAPPPPAPPGPDNVFEFGYPETPPAPPPPGPDNVFEYGYPEPTPPEQPPYDYIDQDPVPPEEPPYDYIDQDPVPPKSPIEELIDTIKDIPRPPIIPVIPIAPTPPTPPEYGPLGPIEWGTVGRVNLPGVNPGFFTTPSPYYQTTSPVQARYSWRQRPLQTGSEYNAALYNAPNIGPAVPFGLREMYRPMDINQYLATLAQSPAPTRSTRG